jgi:hypothetical protein
MLVEFDCVLTPDRTAVDVLALALVDEKLRFTARR